MGRFDRLTQLRDTFLDAEKEYLDELRQTGKYEEVIATLNEMDIDTIQAMVLEKITSIERGEVPEERLSRVEGEVIVMLASLEGMDINDEWFKRETDRLIKLEEQAAAARKAKKESGEMAVEPR